MKKDVNLSFEAAAHLRKWFVCRLNQTGALRNEINVAAASPVNAAMVYAALTMPKTSSTTLLVRCKTNTKVDVFLARATGDGTSFTITVRPTEEIP